MENTFNWKKILIIVVAICLLVSIVIGCFVWASRRAPDVKDIYDRVVELVENSYEINTLLYGAGLPVYQTDSVYADFTHMYYDFDYVGDYEIVSEYAKFLSEQEIKDAAERVYSTAYLEEVVYPAVFDGYAISDGMGDAAFAYARFIEENEWLYQSTQEDNYLTGMRIYDYSTMKIIAPSTNKACNITMSSWLENEPDQVITVKIRLVLQEDGLWYLDSFTG